MESKNCKILWECFWEHKRRIVCCHFCEDKGRCPEKCRNYEAGISYEKCEQEV